MLSKNHESPLRLLIATGITIFLAECLVMIFLRFFPVSPPFIEALVDASFLMILVSPVLYFYVFRHLIGHINERRRIEDRLNYLAYYDDLTGLPNGTLFRDRLDQALSLAKREQHPLALLFLDIDRLKRINDSMGREIGDRLIQTVGRHLEQNLRESDSAIRLAEDKAAQTVARFAGDEFVVLLPKISKAQDAAIVAERIFRLMSQPITVNEQQLVISCSIGIGLYPMDGDSSEALIRNAAAATHQMKQEGGNHFRFYSSDIHAKTFERLTMESQLRGALAQDQFRLYYQAQIDLKTGRITGVEALIRWQHPDRGMVSPAQFIPVAEETGLIVPIGKWILETAFAQNKRWQDAGLPPITMAVNLSARQFHEKNFVETVKDAVNQSGLNPRYVELELTESLMQNTEKAIVILNAFRAMGINISIDDFGTGYSSLNYLKRFPIHKLKIDQSFVRDSSSNPDDAAIVHAIITLARAMSLEVIAEGVETEAQCAFLREQHCDEAQGYLFSKPLPADEATRLLKEGRSFRKTTHLGIETKAGSKGAPPPG